MSVYKRRRIMRYFWCCFFAWILINHGVRIFCGPGKGGVNDPTSGMPHAVANSLSGVNGIRLAVGKKVRGLDNYCPLAVGGFCAVTLDGMITIMGLSS